MSERFSRNPSPDEIEYPVEFGGRQPCLPTDEDASCVGYHYLEILPEEYLKALGREGRLHGPSVEQKLGRHPTSTRPIHRSSHIGQR